MVYCHVTGRQPLEADDWVAVRIQGVDQGRVNGDSPLHLDELWGN